MIYPESFYSGKIATFFVAKRQNVNLIKFGGGFMLNITLKWHGPYSLERIENKVMAYEYGIYAIYQFYRSSEKLLYIGKTSRDFVTRLKEHFWLNGVNGQVKVRLGVIQLEDGQFSSKRLGDVESLLIAFHSPPENTTNTIYYYGREKLAVLSTGRRGQIQPRVSTDDFE